MTMVTRLSVAISTSFIVLLAPEDGVVEEGLI